MKIHCLWAEFYRVYGQTDASWIFWTNFLKKYSYRISWKSIVCEPSSTVWMDIQTLLEFSGQSFEKKYSSNFMKIHCLWAEFYRVDGQTDATKPIVAFRNFAYAPKWTDWPRSSILETSVVWFRSTDPPRLPTRTSDPTIKPTRFDSTRRREENADGRCWAMKTRPKCSNDSGSWRFRYFYFGAWQCESDPTCSCPRQQLYSISDQDDVATCKDSDAS